MRLDKFLKLSRLIKRRPVANSMCSGGKIKIDERAGKAGSRVQKGQILEIDYGRKKMKIKVLEVPEKNVSKEKAAELYETIEEIWVHEI